MTVRDSLLERASARAKARYGEATRVIDATQVLWSGWEMDHTAVLVRKPDGTLDAFILDAVPGPGSEDIEEMLRARIDAYMLAAHETAKFLVAWRGRPKPTIRDLTDEEAAAIINGGDDEGD